MVRNWRKLPEAEAVFARPFVLIVPVCPFCWCQHWHPVMHGTGVMLAGVRKAPCSGAPYFVRWNGLEPHQYRGRQMKRCA